MHKSRLCAFVLDCKVEDLDRAAQFWQQALNREVRPADPDSPTYRQLQTGNDEPILLLQKVDHDSRIHLDIETDDVDAEVARLEKLGAKRVNKVHTWWVMEAPSGQRFCVVRPQRPELLSSRGSEWK